MGVEEPTRSVSDAPERPIFEGPNRPSLFRKDCIFPAVMGTWDGILLVSQATTCGRIYSFEFGSRASYSIACLDGVSAGKGSSGGCSRDAAW